MKKWKYTLIIFGFLWAGTGYAQDKKVEVIGAARGVFYNDDYQNETEQDTVTPRKLQSGHAMVDLGVNVFPNEKIMVQALVRIRNDYGGFWGSGVTFDVRQLYIKGVIGNVLRYQLGDINYKLSPYTFNNQEALLHRFDGLTSSIAYDQVKYDVFYTDDDTWRQQGAAIDFALLFKKGLREMAFDLFTTRVRPTNFDTQDDRLYSGGSVIIDQSKYLKLGVQYASLYDFKGTSNNTTFMRNPVWTFSGELFKDFKDLKLNLGFEGGNSTLEWQGDSESPVLKDYFYDLDLTARWKGLEAKVGYKNVGSHYRSAGSQTLRINYDRAPLAYDRYGNGQELRGISLFDLARDASLYQTQIQAGLMNFDPKYDNVSPYGVATPNRKGFLIALKYEDKKERFMINVETKVLDDVVGQGTSILKDYNELLGELDLSFSKMMDWKRRDFVLTFGGGLQNTNRYGVRGYDDIDLDGHFYTGGIRFSIIQNFDLLLEYRKWQSKGNELLPERDEYSQIIDYREYLVDYDEDLFGAGLMYRFTPKIQLSALWQNFNWTDKIALQQNYSIQTWTVFFTMKF